MATTQFGRSNFVIQVAESELTWAVSWGLERDEWFNFQISPGLSDGPNDEPYPSTMVITRQWVTTSHVPPWEVRAWFTVKNASPPGSELVFSFCGLKSKG